MRIAIFCTNPPNEYFGGRYHALMMAEALALAGHEVHFVTNVKPIFYDDLSLCPAHEKVRLDITSDFETNLPEDDFDIAVLVPGTPRRSFYFRTQRFALERHAHLVLLNFESGNWFNSLSPVKRHLSAWKYWLIASKTASMILSSAAEGNKFAKSFYGGVPPHCRFDYCYPAINTQAADLVTGVTKEKRIFVMMRFQMSEHKGANRLQELVCKAMCGYTLVILQGPGEIPVKVYKKMRERAQKYGVKIELKYKLSDVEKFREIKRSRLMLFPSYFEGYGYPPVEAQYCNVPCIAFDLPVLRETSGDGIIYARHGDWNDFVRKIEDTLAVNRNYAHLRNQIAKIARLENQAERLDKVLLPLAEQKQPLEHLKQSRLNQVALRLEREKRRECFLDKGSTFRKLLSALVEKASEFRSKEV